MLKHGTQSDPQAFDRSIRATVDACIDPSRGTIVGMAYEAVYALAKELHELRELRDLYLSWREDQGGTPGRKPGAFDISRLPDCTCGDDFVAVMGAHDATCPVVRISDGSTEQK